MSRRLLHVVPSLAPRDGGPSAATIGICRALRAHGEDALIATTDADGPARLAVPIGEPTDFSGVPALFFRRQLSESFKWSRPLADWLNVHVAEFGVVHVHAVFSHSSIAAGRACRRLGVPYVVRPLGTLDPWSLARHAGRKRLLMAAGARALLTGAAVMHYTAAEEQRLAEGALPWLSRGVVVPLVVDDDLFRDAHARRPQAGRVALTMARLDPKKGLDVLIEACHRLAAAGTLGAWRLAIAGDGPSVYAAELRRLAAAGPARDRIAFHGWVSGPERTALLQSASVFVLPSLQENFGIAVVEAMAAGMPVIVSPGVNLAEEIERAGAGWTSARAPDALAAVLTRALVDDRELEQRGRRARAFAESFRWTTVADRLVAVYDDLCRPV